MLRDGDNANIWISIESHKDGCYENNQLTPAFNSLTAVYNNTQCCHRNTACIGKVSCIIILHGNWKRKFAEGSLRWKSPVTGARYFRRISSWNRTTFSDLSFQSLSLNGRSWFKQLVFVGKTETSKIVKNPVFFPGEHHFFHVRSNCWIFCSASWNVWNFLKPELKLF